MAVACGLGETLCAARVFISRYRPKFRHRPKRVERGNQVSQMRPGGLEPPASWSVVSPAAARAESWKRKKPKERWRKRAKGPRNQRDIRGDRG